ncbi:methyltransferase domain-containing protein [Geoglobus sp.]
MDVKDRVREYWDRRSSDYDRSPGHSGLEDLWKDVLRTVFERRMRILDIGTGTGFLAILLAELGHDVTGIDISEGMLSVARRKAEERGLEIDFRIADAENLPFEDSDFDATICRHVLWTLPNPDRAVSEWVRVVSHGGKVVVIDGSWQGSSLGRAIGRCLVALYEGRNPLRSTGYDGDLSKHLPLHRTMSKHAVLELMRGAGISRTRVMDLEWLRAKLLEGKPFFYRLAWGNRSYFLVEGIKEV